VHRRLREHRRCLRMGTHENRRLQAAWDKHGEGAFLFAVVGYVEREKLLEVEQLFIDAARACGPVYNLKTTADPTVAGIVRSRETRAKLSAVNRAKWADPEYAARMRAAAQERAEATRAERERLKAERAAQRAAERAARPPKTPKKLDPELQRRMTEAARQACLGRVPTEEHRRRLSEGNRNRVITEQHRANLSASHKKRKHTDEEKRAAREGQLRWLQQQREADPKRMAKYLEKLRRASLTPEQKERERLMNLSAALKGRKLSPETCAKISAAQKGKPKRQPKRGPTPIDPALLDLIVEVVGAGPVKGIQAVSWLSEPKGRVRRALDHLVECGRLVRRGHSYYGAKAS
jgi:group I intron endonuclease